MPYKHNESRRHHIKKMKYHITNWSEYDAALRQRGSLTFWVENDALESWQNTGQAGQARYTDMAIQTSLVLRAVFKLAFRQTEGLLSSLIELMALPLKAPDHTTLSRRSASLKVKQSTTAVEGPLDIVIDSTGLKVYGVGQWLEDKHGKKSARSYRKLHLAIDTTGKALALTLTDQHADDPSQVRGLLDQIHSPVAGIWADGAYDRSPVYQSIFYHSPDATIIIPPRADAILHEDSALLEQRNQHLLSIQNDGRLKWQTQTHYGKRSLVETTMGRYKALIGTRLSAREFAAQQTEVSIGVLVLNRMLDAGRPHSVRGSRKAA
jgi:transposase